MKISIALAGLSLVAFFASGCQTNGDPRNGRRGDAIVAKEAYLDGLYREKAELNAGTVGARVDANDARKGRDKVGLMGSTATQSYNRDRLRKVDNDIRQAERDLAQLKRD